MKINYTVHSIGNDKIPTEVQFDGQTIVADVAVVTVELVSDDPRQGNPVLRVSPNDPLAAMKFGSVVVGTFEALTKESFK